MHILFPKMVLVQIKRLEKKYPSVRKDILIGMKSFDLMRSISIGKNVYKIRIASSDLTKGKSGGFRAYLYLKIQNQILVPLCIYPKSEIESISKGKLAYFMQQAKQEFLDYL